MIGNGLEVKTRLLFFLVAIRLRRTKGKRAALLAFNVLPRAQ